MPVERANLADVPEILDLQKHSYQTEAALYNDFSRPLLTRSRNHMSAEFRQEVVFKIAMDARVAT